MSDEKFRAGEFETSVYREAMDAFVEVFDKRLQERTPKTLIGSHHEHHALMRFSETSGCVLRIQIGFGDELTLKDLQELISAAEQEPGGIVRS